jgi:diguanylate cyclase
VNAPDTQLQRTASKDRSDRALFELIGGFLLEHRLEPTPANYLLAWALVTRGNAAAVAAVEEATSGGVRLSQREADLIVGETGLGATAPADSEMAVAAAKRQLDLVEFIVGTSQADAERYGRDLAHGVAQLTALPGHGAIEDLLRITAQMMDRTKEAEQQLQRTNEEVQTLRRELASASEEARTDALTGLNNRRALEDRFNALQKSGVPFSAAVCDIDSFKSINDRHGHLVGDRVLKAVAQVLESACDGHLVYRFGGEEFVVLMAHVHGRAASLLIDAARAMLSARHFRVRETDAEVGVVTLSAGVAEVRPGESWAELLMRADSLLYRAKQEGRNRVLSDLPGTAE